MNHTFLTRRGLSADRLMAVTLGCGFAASVAIGLASDENGLALLVGGALAAIGLAMWRLAPGSLASRLTFAITLMGTVTLQIQLSHGTTELHFGVFVVIGVLLAYSDWRPILAAAATIAALHLVTDRLQAAGLAAYCTSSASLARVLIHALYVIIQSGAEIAMAVSMARVACREQESAASLAAAMQQLRDAMATTTQAAVSVENASCEIASGNVDLSQRTENTANQLQRLACSMGRLIITVRDSAQFATDANRVASEAAIVAERGSDLVAKVETTMTDITTSSHKIADITGVIDGIAFQTNILALNAAVEAARAGEQGRGFAVVASEVRSLAQRSAIAAREIKVLIETSVENVVAGSQLVDAAGESMREVVAGARSVATSIEQIARASADQRHGIEDISASLGDLDQMTRENSTLVEQSAAAAESLKTQSSRLADVGRRFSGQAISG